MQINLQRNVGRPPRYSNYDGTGEMAFGLMALGFTLLGYLQTHQPKDSMWRRGTASMLLFCAVILLLLGLLHWVPKAIKQHITWPRTGYVALREPAKFAWKGKRSVWRIAAGAAVGALWIACLMQFAMRHEHDPMSLIWMSNVAIYVAGYAFLICRFEKARSWKWLVFLLMALGVLAIGFFVPGDFAQSWPLMFLFVGLAWLGSGVANLCLFMRHNKLPAPDAE